MTDYVELRRALANQLGDERYRRFVKQGVRKGRLRYWQEAEWRRFTTECPHYSITLDELSVALRICYLHDDELQPGTVKTTPGMITFTKEYEWASANLFPRAADFFLAERFGDASEGVPVWYCPACRQAKAAWSTAQKSQILGKAKRQP